MRAVTTHSEGSDGPRPGETGNYESPDVGTVLECEGVALSLKPCGVLQAHYSNPVDTYTMCLQ